MKKAGRATTVAMGTNALNRSIFRFHFTPHVVVLASNIPCKISAKIGRVNDSDPGRIRIRVTALDYIRGGGGAQALKFD